MKHILFSLLFLFSVTALLAQEGEAYVNFEKGEWAEVVAKAEAEGKFIMVDALTDWCYWCKVMDEKTFRDAEVADFINQNFVSYKIDCEKGMGSDFAMKFRISGFPTLVFFNSQGQLAGRKVGYEQDNGKFVEGLSEILAVGDAQQFSFDSKVMDPGFPDFYKNAFKRDDVKGVRIQEDVATAFLDEQEDLFNEVSFSVMWKSPLNEKYSQFFQENFDRYAKMYGQDESSSVLTSIAYGHMRKATKEKDEAMLDKAMATLAPLDEETKEAYGQSFRMGFFQATENWNEYAALFNAMFEKEEISEIAGRLNQGAWTIYEKCDDKELLEMASGWMKKVVKESPEYAYVDTYAAVLFKSGQLDKAEKWASKAIDIAKESEEKADGTVKLLEEIQQAKENQ